MMKILFKNLFFNILLAQSFFSSATVTQGEYVMKDGEIPICLHHSMRHVDEEIFPREIKIKLSLYRIEGTLLYTIDKKGNQLIVTLYEDPEERMKIEMRGEEYYVTLRELCGYHKCRYEMLVLTFRVANKSIVARCNTEHSINWTISENKLINKAYPVINKDDNNAASVWLVNTPAQREYHPKNTQLFGCIFDVLYNGKSINMDIIGSVVNKCENSCDENTCYSGACFCDCITSFVNGKYCNTQGLPDQQHRIKSGITNFKFETVNIAWKSNSTEIFSIQNEKIKIELIVESTNLKISCHYRKGLTIISSITIDYEHLSNNTLILEFNQNKIIVKYVSEKETINSRILSLGDLSKEEFTSMELLNGIGMIDVVYKTYRMQIGWINAVRKDESEHGNTKTNETNKTFFVDWQIIMIIILSVLLFVSLSFVCVTIYYMNKQHILTRINTEETLENI